MQANTRRCGLSSVKNAAAVLRQQREVGRIEWRDRGARILEAVESPFREPLFSRWPRADLDVETEIACDAARRVRRCSSPSCRVRSGSCWWR